MGVDKNLYAGPYMIIKNKKITVDRIKTICSNNECENKDKKVLTNFCPLCGRPTTEKKVKESKVLNARDILYDDDDDDLNEDNLSGIEFYGEVIEGHSVMLPNFKIPGTISADLGSSDAEIIEVAKDGKPSSINTQKDIDFFKEKIAKELKKLDEKEVSYEIEWGIIYYCS